MATLADYLRQLCKQEGVTLREGSLRANLPPEALSQLIRRQDRYKPKPETLRMIADALHGDFIYMMTLAGHLLSADPDHPSIPHLAEFVDVLSTRPADIQERIMRSFLTLLEMQEAANAPTQTALLSEPAPDDAGHPVDAG